MATIVNNAVTRGFRGKFGNDMVFKTIRGKTYVMPPARKPDKKKESVAQRQTRSTFREATEWAHHILLDEKKKAYYKQRAKALKLPNAYTAAITDYMRKAKVDATPERNKKVVCAVRKAGFTIPKVKVTIQNTEEAQPVVTIRQLSTQWAIEVVKPVANRQYVISITITDNFGRERIEEMVI